MPWKHYCLSDKLLLNTLFCLPLLTVKLKICFHLMAKKALVKDILSTICIFLAPKL